MGGSYKDHRIVGTMPDMFDDLEYGDGQKYEFEKKESKREKDDESTR